jgi:protoporphyrinogen oxidase
MRLGGPLKSSLMPGGDKKTAVVIGAGPMGLSTAYYLQKNGWQVTVLEASDRIGGMSAHFDFDGLDVERYYHFICKGDAPLLSLLEELRLTSLLRWNVTRMGFYYDGEMYEWGRPDALWSFPHLRKRDKLRYALHVLRSRSMRDWHALDDVDATDWIRRWVGDRAYDMLWRKTFELKFNETHTSVSAAWIAARIRRVSLSRRDSFHEEMGFIKGGSEIILEELRRRIEAGGGSVVVNAPVDRVHSENGQVTGVQVGTDRHDADCVVSTMPLQFIPEVVPQLSAGELKGVRALKSIGVVCVKFKLRSAFTPYFWINVNDERIVVPGIIEYTNLNPLAAHIVYVPYYMPQTHPKWSWEASKFEAEALAMLRIMRPDWDPSEVEAAHVSRYRYAQPICPPGFVHQLPRMRTSINGFLMADTSYCYPEDRSINDSVLVAQRLADSVGRP